VGILPRRNFGMATAYWGRPLASPDPDCPPASRDGRLLPTPQPLHHFGAVIDGQAARWHWIGRSLDFAALSCRFSRLRAFSRSTAERPLAQPTMTQHLAIDVE
jgi:hypothetical protein